MSSHVRSAFRSMTLKKTVARPEDLFEKELLWAWLESAQLGMCLLNATGELLSANAVLAEQFAIPQEMLFGASFERLGKHIVADAELMKWAVTPDADGKRSHVFQRDYKRVDLSIQATTLRYHSGERFRVLAVTDETLLKRAQLIADLDRSSRQWEALNAGVVISDALRPDMPIIYVNSVFERMSGYSAAEVVGRNCRFLQGAETDQPDLPQLRDAIKREVNGHALLRNYRKDGSIFFNELFVSPVRNDAGVVTQFIGVQHLRSSR